MHPTNNNTGHIPAAKKPARQFEAPCNRGFLLLLLLLLMLFFPMDGESAEDDYFAIRPLSIDGSQIDYIVEDLDNDDKQDLLFFHVLTIADQPSRKFSIFYQTRNGFSQTADQCFEIDPDAVVYFVSDVHPAPGKEIVFFKSTGLFCYISESGRFMHRPELLIETDSIFKLPDTAFMEHYPFARDLNDDGIDEILVPRFEGVAVYRRDNAGKYIKNSMLPAPMQTTTLSAKEVSRYLSTTYTIPNVVVMDYNNDTKKDIIFIQETHLAVFFQTGGLIFSKENQAAITFGREMTQAYALQIRNHNIYQRNRFEDKACVRALEDLNRDGLIDLIIENYSVTESLFNPQKTMSIFFGRPSADTPARGAAFNKVPDNTIVTTGFPGRSSTIDLDDDNKKELLVPSVDLGFFKVIRILLTGNLDISVHVYQLNQKGTYDLKPGKEICFTVDIDRKGREIPVSSFNGDFNGDERKDYLGAVSDTIVLVLNTGDGTLKTTPDVVFPVPVPENGLKVRPHYLNNDPFSDIVIVYNSRVDESRPEGKSVCLLMNKGSEGKEDK